MISSRERENDCIVDTSSSASRELPRIRFTSHYGIILPERCPGSRDEALLPSPITGVHQQIEFSRSDILSNADAPEKPVTRRRGSARFFVHCEGRRTKVIFIAEFRLPLGIGHTSTRLKKTTKWKKKTPSDALARGSLEASSSRRRRNPSGVAHQFTLHVEQSATAL